MVVVMLHSDQDHVAGGNSFMFKNIKFIVKEPLLVTFSALIEFGIPKKMILLCPLQLFD